MAKKRLFVAADVSDSQREALAHLCDNLAKGIRFTRAHPKWVAPEALHLTLKFLGEVEESRTAKIVDAVAPSIARIPPIQMDLEGLGVFPSAREPKVLWVGIDHGRKQFIGLSGAVQSALARIGFPRDQRDYHPHLTLARIKALRGANEMMDVVESHRHTRLPGTTIEKVTLYESELLPEGARYTPLHHWPMATSPTGNGAD